MRRLAAFLFLASFAAADPVTLEVKLPKGKSFKVDSSLIVTTNAGPATTKKSGNMTSTMATIVQTPFVLLEKWTDTCVEEADGVPSQIRRAITSSRLASTKAPSGPTSQEGCLFLISRAEKGSTVKAEKGKPEDLSIRLLEKGPPDLIEFLLPDHAVSEGDEWKVDGSLNSGFQLSASAGKAGAQGNAKNALRKDIDRMDDKQSPIGVGTAGSGGGEVTATLKSIKDGVATIEFAAEHEIDKSKIANGADFDIPKSRTIITGKLTFEVETGKPLKLSWVQKHIVEEMETKNGKVPESSEEWTLVRTYAK